MCHEDLQLTMQSMPFTTNVLSSNLTRDEMYSIEHYVIKFACDLRHVGGFLRVLWFPARIKTDRHDIEILLSTIALTQSSR